MFFPERIKSIRKTDLVLEIGPGADPFKRSDILLEKKFVSEEEARSQRAGKNKLKSSRQIVFFDGARFPFKDNAFDYVICSHVLEHVDDVDNFVSEIARIGKRGYLEFPTVYYDYIYNFDVHKSFLLYYDGTLKWMPKSDTGLNDFLSVQRLFYKANLAGRKSIIKEMKEYFFQGFEWESNIKVDKVIRLKEVSFEVQNVRFRDGLLQFLKRIKYKVLDGF